MSDPNENGRHDRRDDRDKTPPLTGVTLSGLLNVLDGFHAPENVVYMMTTNSVESLDPALLRPGRIDYRLYMGEASLQQRVELYRRFFPEASEAQAREFAEAHCAQTMAEFQGLLLSLEQNADQVVANGEEVTASPARELETAAASH